MPELFKEGILEMSTTPLKASGSAALWGDCAVNRITLVLTLLLFLLSLSDYIRVFPSLLRCAQRWKGNAELEHSVSLARTRDNLALLAALALCLIADRWQLIAPSFKMALPAEWHLAVTAGLVGGTVLLRRLLFLATKWRSRTSEFASTFRHTLFNYTILLVSLMLLTITACVLLRVPDGTVRLVLYAESLSFWLLHLLRTGQFLRSRCGSLATILYLCALEILPVGSLIFVCTL